MARLVSSKPNVLVREELEDVEGPLVLPGQRAELESDLAVTSSGCAGKSAPSAGCAVSGCS
jgi:hypothetical protein